MPDVGELGEVAIEGAPGVGAVPAVSELERELDAINANDGDVGIDDFVAVDSGVWNLGSSLSVLVLT